MGMDGLSVEHALEPPRYVKIAASMKLVGLLLVVLALASCAPKAKSVTLPTLPAPYSVETTKGDVLPAVPVA